MSSGNRDNNDAADAATNLNIGLPLTDRQVSALVKKFGDGEYFGHINFGLETGRLTPYRLVECIKSATIQLPSFILLLGYLLRKGMNPNHYFEYSGLGMRQHILSYIYTTLTDKTDFRYIADMFVDAGSSLYLPAFEGTNSERTVRDSISFNEVVGLEETDYNLNSIMGIDPTVKPEIRIKWGYFKTILLDRDFKNNQEQGDILSFLMSLELGERFMMRSIVMYLCVYCNSENCLRKSRDDQLFLNSLGNVNQSTYMAINSQNLNIFKIMMDKGSECNYICMTELIARHNTASKKKDEILTSIFGDMIDYAVLTGSEIDQYQLQYLSLQASAELVERITTNYEETEWNKSCNVIKSGGDSKFASMKLRQMAFNLNINYDLSPEKICEKLSVIANTDRVEFVKESIIRQEERVAKELLNKGEVRGDEDIKRVRCNPKSRLINNPYAYNDARMASYFDQTDGQLYCFTSDLFEGLVKTRKNPYNNKPLPNVFIETIKAQINVLRYLKLDKPKDSKKIGESVREIFDERKSVTNKIGEEIYYDGLILYRLYTEYGEDDYRNRISASFSKIVEKFVELSFVYTVDINNIISSNFLKDRIKDNNRIREPNRNGGIYDTVNNNPGSLPDFKYDSKKFKLISMFKSPKYRNDVINSGFNEISYRVISSHITSLNNFYKNGREMQNNPFYSDYSNNMKYILEYFINYPSA
jgi:hypothetical protein